MSLPSAGPHDSRIRVFLDRNLTSRILLQELRKAQITKDMGLDIRAHPDEARVKVGQTFLSALFFISAGMQNSPPDPLPLGRR